ncbi:acyl-CoA/acyl-ACP dehydrogenase [Parahaliea sp. F7430]|uniref:Acyl-CoA/acyl-ACP dehydrogenase n=1 Tax=Sediminihaliea albiluteola TaxID=2758564 RepID=A0A7W2YKK3_9GAMM|nr:acyl-CoA dehydrogenase family protein [Sediminihaliea albiluteola]MBA6414260.1 acyl-CoA/acyl-ACP dehydrogenase [Sediminihaliea albiluteola]
MEFTFTDEQLMIRDTAEAFLAEVSTSEAVRAAMVTEAGYDPQLWQRVCEEMFWQAIHIPEEYGGMGLGYVELVAMLEQMGRYLFCSPFFSTVCLGVNALLVAANDEQKAQYLPEIVAGKTATLAFASANGGWASDSVTATFSATDNGFVLDGSYRYVTDGHSADLLIVAAREAGSEGEQGISLFVLPADSAGVSRRWLPTMDQTRKQAELNFEQVAVPASALLGESGQAGAQLEQILDLARVAIAADQVGGTQQALDITVEYLQERQQFGRVIASYQAVKHKAADMMLKAEAGRSALYYAACVADESLQGGPLADQLSEAASIAKAYCSEAYFFNAGCGIQLFGGVGFTSEYDIQLYFKRAKSTETFLGDASWHRERLARQLLDGESAA